MFIEILLGFTLALVLFFIGIRLFPKSHLSKWASGLIIAAIIYVFFALTDISIEWLSFELLGVGLYSIPAVLSLRYSKYWLALGWGFHIFWDILLHGGGHPGFVPQWYPGLCLGFDLAIAGAVVWWIMKGKAEIQSQAVK